MKKPGEFKKQQQKHHNIQHNRDQMKLLREDKIERAELFILDPDGFKKVTVKKFDNNTHHNEDYGGKIVYLQHAHNHTQLRTGEMDRDGKIAHITPSGSSHLYVHERDLIGVVTHIEMLKPSELKDKNNYGTI